ncbi:MAG: hypothetical protein ACE5GW_10735 [Planctomycetota bacterium]
MRLLADPPDREGAVRILEEGLAREHGDDALAQLLNDLAAIELERGQAGRAKELLQRGLALSESALRRYNLGEVFASLGEPERALEEYRRAITLDRGRFAYRRAWARVSGELSPSRRLEALQVVTAWVMAEEINVEEGQVLQRQIGPFREEGR